jgi:8-oxo-dGTP pyrophosphatase MutT (NUDIX family)
LDAVLLTQHRKLNRWLQLGGHVDGESDVLVSSVREAQEESGIDEIEVLLASPIDIDIHEIPARKDEPAHCHYDLRFLLMAKHENIQISEESIDLRWLPFSEIGDFIDELSMLRLHAKSQAWLSQYYPI